MEECKRIAILSVKSNDKYEMKAVIDWLNKLTNDLEKDMDKYANKFTARFFLPIGGKYV